MLGPDLCWLRILIVWNYLMAKKLPNASTPKTLFSFLFFISFLAKVNCPINSNYELRDYYVKITMLACQTKVAKTWFILTICPILHILLTSQHINATWVFEAATMTWHYLVGIKKKFFIKWYLLINWTLSLCAGLLMAIVAMLLHPFLFCFLFFYCDQVIYLNMIK